MKKIILMGTISLLILITATLLKHPSANVVVSHLG